MSATERLGLSGVWVSLSKDLKEDRGRGEQGPCTHLSRAVVCLVLRLLQRLLLEKNNGGGGGLLLTSGAGLSLYPLQLPHILLILAEKGSCWAWKSSDSRASWTADLVAVSQTAALFHLISLPPPYFFF